MKTIEIERWALRVLEAVERRDPVEDSTVELKANWIPPERAARRLAGHANAAGGANILWLIGVHERGEIVGAEFQELSSWFRSVQSEFDGVAPELDNSVNVRYNGKTVAALCFDTSGVPYVVKNPAFKQQIRGECVEREVPWREATSVRSARRSDLLLLLASLRRMPKLELLSGEVRLAKRHKETEATVDLDVSVEMYVVPLDETPIVFPFHKCSAVVIGRETGFRVSLETLQMEPASGKQLSTASIRRLLSASYQRETHVTVDAKGETIEATGTEIRVGAPGKIRLWGWCQVPAPVLGNLPQVEIQVTLVEAVTDLRVTRSWVSSVRGAAEADGVWHFGPEHSG